MSFGDNPEGHMCLSKKGKPSLARLSPDRNLGIKEDYGLFSL